MKFILFRHGDKQLFKENSEILEERMSRCLSTEGITQIKKLSNFFKTQYPELQGQKIIYSSPWPRAIQSAEIVRGILNISEIQTYSEFKEFHPIEKEKMTIEERSKWQKKAAQNPNQIIPELNKSPIQIVESFLQRLKSIQKINKTNIVLISTHGISIRKIIKFLDKNINTDYKKIKMIPSSHSTIELINNKFKVITFNSNKHLL